MVLLEVVESWSGHSGTLLEKRVYKATISAARKLWKALEIQIKVHWKAQAKTENWKSWKAGTILVSCCVTFVTLVTVQSCPVLL